MNSATGRPPTGSTYRGRWRPGCAPRRAACDRRDDRGLLHDDGGRHVLRLLRRLPGPQHDHSSDAPGGAGRLFPQRPPPLVLTAVLSSRSRSRSCAACRLLPSDRRAVPGQPDALGIRPIFHPAQDLPLRSQSASAGLPSTPSRHRSESPWPPGPGSDGPTPVRTRPAHPRSRPRVPPPHIRR